MFGSKVVNHNHDLYQHRRTFMNVKFLNHILSTEEIFIEKLTGLCSWAGRTSEVKGVDEFNSALR